MKKAIFIVAVAILFSCCLIPGYVYYFFGITNKSSQTLLFTFYDGENENPNLEKFEPGDCRDFMDFEFKKPDGKDASFYLLWSNPKSEVRIYNADTVLLRIWKPDFNRQSKQKEFFRESDWRREEFGEWNTNSVNYCFEIQDSDLPSVNSVSAQ